MLQIYKIIMGACVGKSEKQKSINKLAELKYIDHQINEISPKKSFENGWCNPQDSNQKQSDQFSRKKSDSTIDRSASEPEAFITIEQLMGNDQNVDDNKLGSEQMKIFASSIVRLSKKKSKQSREQQLKSIIPMDSQIKLQSASEYVRLSLKLEKLDFDFVLEKSRAGPLVVPLIAYENYDP